MPRLKEKMRLDGFETSKLAEQHKADLDHANETAANLSDRRKSQVSVEGPLAKSKLAWKVAVYQQSVLYRLVELFRGTADAWNKENNLVSLLGTRAFVETVAVLWDFKTQLVEYQNSEDLDRLGTLITNRIFSTRDPALLKESSDIQAVNVLTIIDKLDRILPGLRGHYDSLSERCHPNSFGHHQMFSKTDYSTGTVTFSDDKDADRYLTTIIAGMGLIEIVATIMDELDRAIIEVAELQHRLNPVGQSN